MRNILLIILLFSGIHPALSQFYVGVNAYELDLNGGGKIMDSTTVFNIDLADLDLGLRAGYRKSSGNTFMDFGIEVNSYFTTFFSEDSTFYTAVWSTEQSGYTLAATKVGLDFAIGTYVGNSPFYGSIGFSPGVLIAGRSLSVIEKINSSDYLAGYLIEATLRLGTKLSQRFDVGFHMYIAANNMIDYETEKGDFSFRTKQLGLTINYRFENNRKDKFKKTEQ